MTTTVKHSLALMGAMVLIIAVLGGTVFAANPHFLPGSPQITQDGDTVTASGSIAGVGNQNLDVELVVNWSQEVQCRNPGGKIAPGQTKSATTSGEQSNLEPDNGRVNFEISVTVGGGDFSASCPNAKWTPIPGTPTIDSVTLNVYQPAGSGILVLTHSQ